MRQTIFALLILVGLTGDVQGAVFFYSDLKSFNDTVTASGASTSVIDFESVPVGDYSTPTGLTAAGSNFIGPYGSPFSFC